MGSSPSTSSASISSPVNGESLETIPDMMTLSFANLNENYFTESSSRELRGDEMTSSRFSTDSFEHYSEEEDQPNEEEHEDSPPSMTRDPVPSFVTESVPPSKGSIHYDEFAEMERDLDIPSNGYASSDDEVEVKKSPGPFHINTDFFSRERPPIQQQESPRAKEESILNMKFSSMMNGSNLSDFRSAYESPNAVETEGRVDKDYDFESDGSEE